MENLHLWKKHDSAVGLTAELTCTMTTVAEESAIRQKNMEWTICYHGKANGGIMKGRAEFLRLMFEDSGTPYQNSSDDLYGPNGMMDCFRGSVDAIAASVTDDRFPFPVMFPPAIWHRPKDGEEVLVNQVGACLIYLGDELGYAPGSTAEKARANSIMLNALDYIAEGRQSFHPVKNHMSYLDQKVEGDTASKEFSKTRMPTFLHHFNKVVLKNASPKSPIAGGENVTFADFCLFHVLHATVEQFNTEFYDKAWDHVDVPQLKEYYEWMKSRPKLQEYFSSDRCARKCCSFADSKSQLKICCRLTTFLSSCIFN
jgi:glutathione S-transferase